MPQWRWSCAQDAHKHLHQPGRWGLSVLNLVAAESHLLPRFRKLGVRIRMAVRSSLFPLCRWRRSKCR